MDLVTQLGNQLLYKSAGHIGYPRDDQFALAQARTVQLQFANLTR
jgi:hypothetical protein